MSFFRRLFGGSREPPKSEPPDSVRAEVAKVYPSGPIRVANLRGIQRALDLTDKAPVIDQIMIFDANDHWFCLLLGCGALDLSFELSIRIGKTPAQTPPD